MHAKEPMYTAIVAAYNVEKYIGSCLDSILKIQDDNLEIIIVTGRKTDQTNHICEEYSLRKNIKLGHRMVWDFQMREIVELTKQLDNIFSLLMEMIRWILKN